MTHPIDTERPVSPATPTLEGSAAAMREPPDRLAELAGVSTATITMVLLKHGLRNIWLRGRQAARAGAGAPGRPGVHHALLASA